MRRRSVRGVPWKMQRIAVQRRRLCRLRPVCGRGLLQGQRRVLYTGRLVRRGSLWLREQQLHSRRVFVAPQPLIDGQRHVWAPLSLL